MDFLVINYEITHAFQKTVGFWRELTIGQPWGCIGYQTETDWSLESMYQFRALSILIRLYLD